MEESTKTQVLRLRNSNVNKMILGDESSYRIQVLKLLMTDRDYVNCKSTDNDFPEKLKEALDNKKPLVIHNLEKMSEENQNLMMNTFKNIKENKLEVISLSSEVEQEVQMGRFREDLYYRLNTVVFAQLHQRLTDKDFLEIEEGIKTNVSASLYEVEKAHILNVLKFFDGDKIKTANSLGITNKTLYIKLHEYDAFDRNKTPTMSDNRCYGQMRAKPSACGCGDC